MAIKLLIDCSGSMQDENAIAQAKRAATTLLECLSAEDFAKKRTASLADIQAHWSVENGELVNDGNGLYATTDRDYRDFELTVDYKILPKGDSGIYLRGIPQVQIWDPTNEQAFQHGADKGSGGLWNNAGDGKFPLKKMDRPLGEWNTVQMTMIGERVTVKLNGEVVVDDAALDNYYTRSQKPDPLPNCCTIRCWMWR